MEDEVMDEEDVDDDDDIDFDDLDWDLFDIEEETAQIIGGMHLTGTTAHGVIHYRNGYIINVPNKLDNGISGPRRSPDRIVSRSFPDAAFYASDRSPSSPLRSLPELSGSAQVEVDKT